MASAHDPRNGGLRPVQGRESWAFPKAGRFCLTGVVLLAVEIEVAAQLTLREFSGVKPEGAADEEDSQEAVAKGSRRS